MKNTATKEARVAFTEPIKQSISRFVELGILVDDEAVGGPRLTSYGEAFCTFLNRGDSLDASATPAS